MLIRSNFVCWLFSWFFPVSGVAIFPFIFVRRDAKDKTIRHERIHIAQYWETWLVGFLFIYLFDFAKALKKYKKVKWAYKKIRFEQEAYKNSMNNKYLERRKKYAWKRYTI